MIGLFWVLIKFNTIDFPLLWWFVDGLYNGSDTALKIRVLRIVSIEEANFLNGKRALDPMLDEPLHFCHIDKRGIVDVAIFLPLNVGGLWHAFVAHCGREWGVVLAVGMHFIRDGLRGEAIIAACILWMLAVYYLVVQELIKGYMLYL